jgi:hypothetical protein
MDERAICGGAALVRDEMGKALRHPGLRWHQRSSQSEAAAGLVIRRDDEVVTR